MRILIVDDEPNIRNSLRTALEARKNTVDEAASVAVAVTRIERSAFDVAFVDLRLGEESGFSLLESIVGRWPRMAVVIITAYASIDSAVDAMRRGAFDYLPKPFTPAQIRAVLERVVRTAAWRASLPTSSSRSATRSLRCRWPAAIRGFGSSWTRAVRSLRLMRRC